MRALHILVLAFAAACPCAAQDMPRPLTSGEIRGRVVADSGAAVDGAVVVVRWNWLDYVAKLHGSGYYFQGNAAHIAEAVTDREGRFTIPAWGPKLRLNGGRLEDNAPTYLVYKAGFEPSAGHDPNVRLLPRYGAAAEHAQRVRSFQERSLVWSHPSENWKSMPRMVQALQETKTREGKDAAAILGIHTLPGRTGAGRLIDQSKSRVTGGYIATEWTLRRADGSPGTARVVHAKRLGTDRYDIDFYVSPYRPAPTVPGWIIDPAIAPDFAIYVPGYRVARVRNWGERGGVVAMERLAQGRDATLDEMREWRRDIDRALGLTDRETALEAIHLLLFAFESRCRGLTPDVRKGICYEPGSEAARFLARPRTSYLVFEKLEGVEEVPVVSAGAGIAASAAAGGRTSYMQRVPVSGFSLEPVKR